MKLNNSTKLLFLIVTSVLVFIICINPPVDPDMWWHLRSGQLMWQEKTILTQDQFSFTRSGYPWVNAFWVSDLIIYFLFVIGGFPLLIILITSISVILFLMIYLRSNGPYFIRSLFILLAAIAISPQWTARPQVLSFFLFALLNFWLERRAIGKGAPLFLLPILFIAWANIHGGFIWGFLLLIATITGLVLDRLSHKTNSIELKHSEITQLSIWSVISLLAVLINPNGFAIWKLPFYTISVSISSIQEWASPNFHDLIVQPFLWMILLLIIGLSLSEKRQSFTTIFKSIGLIFMAFVSQRNIPISILVITPILIDRFSEYYLSIPTKVNSTTAESRLKFSVSLTWILNSVIFIFLIIFAVLRAQMQLSPELVDNKFPAKAIESIELLQPKGNIFNSYNWGGYLVWNLQEYPVFIDGRADLYGKDIIDNWWEVVNGTDKAMDILDKNKINFILLEPDWPIIDLLKTNHWKVTYQDKISIVMVRN